MLKSRTKADYLEVWKVIEDQCITQRSAIRGINMNMSKCHLDFNKNF